MEGIIYLEDKNDSQQNTNNATVTRRVLVRLKCSLSSLRCRDACKSGTFEWLDLQPPQDIALLKESSNGSPGSAKLANVLTALESLHWMYEVNSRCLSACWSKTAQDVSTVVSIALQILFVSLH